MEYENGKLIIQYDDLKNKDYVIEQLKNLGLAVDSAFKYTPQVAVEVESLPKNLEEKIMSIELNGKTIVRKINKVGIIKTM
jgi:hypothetical protein